MNLPMDSVYILALADWRSGTRGSGWHYARRWSAHVPVMIVQAELPGGAAPESEPAAGLDNCEILSIREQAGYPSLSLGLIQAGQLLAAMRRRGHRRPLLWLYNPCLLFAYALTPALGRIYHAVENYFEWKTEAGYWEIDGDFVDMARAAAAISDKVICFSAPTVERFRAETGRQDIELVPIGCDYRFYAEPRPAAGPWLEALRPILAEGTPIAVCAGNINLKIDFPLLHRLAEALAEVHFVYEGPVAYDHLDAADRASWDALLRRRNVTHLGRIEFGDLPCLYHIADRGFIPYRPLPFFTRSAFPLKALEMAAAGLPVVASLMQPLLEVPDAVAVAPDAGAFVEKLGSASRRTRSAEAAARAEAVCRAYDYDRLFERAVQIVSNGGVAARPRPASLAPIYECIGLGRMISDLADPEAKALNAELAEENEAYRAEIARLNEVYSAEIARLNEVYPAEIVRLNTEIARLDAARRELSAVPIVRLYLLYRKFLVRGSALFGTLLGARISSRRRPPEPAGGEEGFRSPKASFDGR